MNVIASNAWNAYDAEMRADKMPRASALLVSLFVASCGGGAAPLSPSSAAPVATPTPAGSLGASGGTLSLANGAVRLSVPAGALSGSVAIEARQASAGPLDPWVVGGSAYEISPSSTTFSTAATLTIRYQAGLRPSGTSAQDLRIHRLVGGRWEPIPGTNDPNLSEAAAPITAAGLYSVRWTGPIEACSLPQDRQFDFWLGEWNLTDLTGGPPGNPAGTNDITRDETGCLIEEDYRSGGQGRSVSLYSRIDGRWHQTYIDSMGNRLILIGSFEGGRMLLNAGATRSFWQPVDRNTVRFVQEQSRDGGQTWTAFFDSRYTRR
jgi:hypothetical protein